MTRHSPDWTEFAPAAGSVPAIPPLCPLTLAAFSTTAATRQALASLAASHPMARVRMTLAEGGIAAAIAACDAAPSPQFLIVEDDGAQDALLSGLDTLAEVCEAGTRVIVIGAQNDIGLYRDLMRRGISEYLPAPVTMAGLLRCLSDLTATPGALRRGQVHAFIGTGGGAGSSTLALNVAWLIGRARHGAARLIDLDLGFGTAGLNLALDAPRGLAEALAAGERLDGQLLDALLARVDDALRVLPLTDGSAQDQAEPDAAALDHLIDLARDGAAHVALDLPCPRTATARRALVNADHVILTASPDLAGLKNATAILSLLRSLRPDAEAPFLVLNKTGMSRRPEISAKDFSAALGLPVTAGVAFDPRGVTQAANAGRVYVAGRRGAAAAQALRPLVQALSGQPARVVTAHVATAPVATGRFARFRARLGGG